MDASLLFGAMPDSARMAVAQGLSSQELCRAPLLPNATLMANGQMLCPTPTPARIGDTVDIFVIGAPCQHMPLDDLTRPSRIDTCRPGTDFSRRVDTARRSYMAVRSRATLFAQEADATCPDSGRAGHGTHVVRRLATHCHGGAGLTCNAPRADDAGNQAIHR